VTLLVFTRGYTVTQR